MKFNKSYISLMIAILCSINAMAAPYDVIIDNICYKLNGNDATVTVYNEDTEVNSNFYKGKINIPESITYNSKTYTVTNIGSKAFMCCGNITDIYLPNSITTISDNAFSLTLELTNMRIGPNVKEIGKDAFNFARLNSLDLDAANKYFVLEDHVLYSADHKRAITLIFCDILNYPSVNLHEDVETIDNGFAHSQRLHSLHLGNKVKSIGEKAFSGAFSNIQGDAYCQTELILPDGIEYIGPSAFEDCILIDNLHLPDSLTRLEKNSFSYVTPQYIHMPKKLKVICDGALECSSGNAYINLVLPEGLDSIGKSGITCINCDSLIVPASVRYLSEMSLDNNSKYIEIKAPLTSIPAFSMPSQSVKELVLPKTVRTLEQAAFYPCYALSKIVWPDSLEYIGQAALAGNQLRPCIIPSTVKTLGSAALSDNVYEARTYYFTSQKPPTCLKNDVFDGIIYSQSTLYVPKGSIDAYKSKEPWNWFGTIEEYDEINIPEEKPRYDFEYNGLYYKILSEEDKTCEVSYDVNKITELNTYTYTSVTIPETAVNGSKAYTVTGFENGAFSHTPLEEVKLPNTLTSISGAFYNTNLSSIDIPESVTDISCAFTQCEKLKTVHVPENVKYIDCAFTECTNLESVNIPQGVTSIGSNTFFMCQNLQSIVLPDEITEIGSNTFMGCSKLASVTLPANLKQIDEGAFEGCGSLKSIVLPSHLYIIKSGAFGECYALKDVTSLNTVTPYPVGSDQFACMPCNVYILHIPAGSRASYESTVMWRNFTIVEDVDVSAINTPCVENAKSKAYDILGRPVNDTYKGIIIKNGKQIINY